MTDGHEDIPLSDVPACECGRLKNMLGGDGRWRCAVCEVEECKRRWAKTMKWLEAKADVEAGKFVNPIRKAVSESKGGRPKKETAAQYAIRAIESDQKPGKIISPVLPKEEDKTAHKTAKLFNTNRTYVNQAAKLKVEAPDVFEQVKAGTMRMTDAARAVKAIPKDDWRADERERQLLCKGGQSVVANASKDQNLIRWAEGEGKAVRIDRGTKYGNPFLLPADGDRDQVCDCYEKHYLPHKPSITSDIGKLKGKVLICHCHPERCHGDCLCGLANEER